MHASVKICKATEDLLLDPYQLLGRRIFLVWLTLSAMHSCFQRQQAPSEISIESFHRVLDNQDKLICGLQRLPACLNLKLSSAKKIEPTNCLEEGYKGFPAENS